MSGCGSRKNFSTISRMALMLVTGASASLPSLLLADEPEADVEQVVVQGQQEASRPDAVVAQSTTIQSNTVKEKSIPVVKAVDEKPVSEESGLSNKTLLGIGGAAVLLGVVAGSSGGGGSSSSIDSTSDSSSKNSAGAGDSGSSSTSTAVAPPTASQMVGVWHANAHSVEGLHYVGTYTLFSNGRHQYSIIGETGKHKSGVGRWDLRGYRLSLHNDSGTTYSGEFKRNGHYTSLTLGTSVGWVLNLHK